MTLVGIKMTLACLYRKLSLASMVLILSILPACFEYSPNQVILDNDEKNLTSKNLKRLEENPAAETIRFVLMGDTQRFYDESSDFVKSVNSLYNIDFVVHAGDISDFGLVKEFQWINDIMKGLRPPYLTVIGNHDLLANGRKIYNEMYGELNYSFEYGNYKFIMLNTNSREYEFDGNVPDLVWLKDQLDANTDNKHVIIVSHIPPFDGDFDDALEQNYAQTLANNSKVMFSLHGHRHNFDDQEYYDDGVRYFVTTSMQKKGYALITLSPSGAVIEIVRY